MRVKITDIHPSDSFYCEKNNWIGNLGVFIDKSTNFTPVGYKSGRFDDSFFYGIKYIEVPEPQTTVIPRDTLEPSAMSELKSHFAGLDVSTYEYDLNTPKKLTWWQKLRGYDELFARMESAEGVRDHYKAISETQKDVIKDRTRDVNYYMSILSEALRDRDLHARTADNWQAKLVKANEEVLQLSDICKYLLNYLDLLDEQKKAEK